MLIRIIVDWEVSIRPYEFANIIKLFNNNGFTPGKAEQHNITNYFTETGLGLSEMLHFQTRPTKKSMIG